MNLFKMIPAGVKLHGGLVLGGGAIGGIGGAFKGATRGTEDQPQGGFFGAASGGIAGFAKGAMIGGAISVTPGLRKGLTSGYGTVKSELFSKGIMDADPRVLSGAIMNSMDEASMIAKPGALIGSAMGGMAGGMRYTGSQVSGFVGGMMAEGRAKNIALKQSNPRFKTATNPLTPGRGLMMGGALGGALGSAAIAGAFVGTAAASGEGHPYNALSTRLNSNRIAQGEHMFRKSRLPRTEGTMMSNPYAFGMRDLNEAYSYSRSNRSSAMPLSQGHMQAARPSRRRMIAGQYGDDGGLVFALNDLRTR